MFTYVHSCVFEICMVLYIQMQHLTCELEFKILLRTATQLVALHTLPLDK